MTITYFYASLEEQFQDRTCAPLVGDVVKLGSMKTPQGKDKLVDALLVESRTFYPATENWHIFLKPKP